MAAEGDDRQPVRRDFDHIVSVLEPLEVVKHISVRDQQETRTINSAVHPHVPTVRLEVCQNYEYLPAPHLRASPKDWTLKDVRAVVF
jgi:hypothetical protein